MWLAEPPLADVVCIYKGISSLAYWLATPMWELGKSLSFLWVYMAHARLSENLLDFSSNLPPLQLVSYSGHNSPNFKWWCWPRLSSSGPGTPCTNESCSRTVMFVGTLLNIKLGKKKKAYYTWIPGQCLHHWVTFENPKEDFQKISWTKWSMFFNFKLLRC